MKVLLPLIVPNIKVFMLKAWGYATDLVIWALVSSLSFGAGYLFRNSTLQQDVAVACGGGTLNVATTDSKFADLPQVTVITDETIPPVWEAGPADAPMQVVVYVDWECPYTQWYLKNVMPLWIERTQTDVRVTVRDFPLPFHKNAQLAAQGARCAARVDKFPEYLAAIQNDPQALAGPAMGATGAMTDVEFARCVAEEDMNVVSDRQAARDLGVSGTPTTIINGRLISGSFPRDVFERLASEALQPTGLFNLLP